MYQKLLPSRNVKKKLYVEPKIFPSRNVKKILYVEEKLLPSRNQKKILYLEKIILRSNTKKKLPSLTEINLLFGPEKLLRSHGEYTPLCRMSIFSMAFVENNLPIQTQNKLSHIAGSRFFGHGGRTIPCESIGRIFST